ncbi:MAG: hypothetical protein QGH74_07810 [Candidatus Brocadiia bacterium]|nr:hypothetical protein [Candidatus Brocadiia bacterium]
MALRIAILVLGLFTAACWIIVMYQWVRSGMPMPRWLHVVALAALAVGIVCAVYVAALHVLTFRRCVLLVLGLPALVYAMWAWMFGPGLNNGI